MGQRRCVVFFGTYDAAVHPRVQVLMDGFEARGAEVVEINVPIGLSTADRVRLVRQPWRAPVATARLAVAWLRLWWEARRARPDLVVVGYLGHLDVRLARRIFDAPIVLDHLVGLASTVRDRGLAGRGWVDRLLDRADRRALAAADVVVYDTDEQAEAAPPTDTPGVVVPVGAPSSWFVPSTAPETGPLRVVFFGLYTPLQGATHIGRAIALLADREDVRFTMIGSGQDHDETRNNAAGSPWVEWIDWVEPARLPAMVADHHVCLGVFGTSDKAARVVPNKTFQGAAAGCLVLTSDTPPQRRLLEGAATFVPAGDPAALAEALAAHADDRAGTDHLRAAAAAVARDRFTPGSIVTRLESDLAAIL